MFLWFTCTFIIGYLLGSLHGSSIAQLISGTNVKKEGVKNSGASNAAIVLGWKFGALVALLDISKGLAAVLGLRIFMSQFDLPAELTWALLFVMSAAVVIGHNFPFYMNFDGGKGTASIIGVMLALDWKLGLAGGLLLIAGALATDYLVVGVLILYGMLFAIAYFPAEGIWPLLTASGLFAMAFWKHIENIKRIKNGTESKVSSVFRKKAGPA